MIYKHIEELLEEAIKKANYPHVKFAIERSKNIHFGNFSSNCVLLLVKELNLAPEKIANEILMHLPKSKNISKIELVKPGFLNFFLTPDVTSALAKEIFEKKDRFGFQIKQKKSYFVEYVSANPTGYLHVGHARNAVFGDTLIRLLKTTGHKVNSEYLINDTGAQIERLAFAVFIRYLQLYKQPVALPEDSYHGKEIILCAKAFDNLYKDKYINQTYQNAKINDSNVNILFQHFAIDFFIKEIKNDLQKYGVEIENWFSEYSMHQKKEIEQLIEDLKSNNDLYLKDNAYWFSASKYIEKNKDEVIIKSDKSTTYYAQDLAYHKRKLTMVDSNCTLINIFGADHHGHVARLQSFIIAMKYPIDKVIFCITQFVRLIKDNKEVKMSKRTGQALTMRDMLEFLDYNCLRWFLVAQSIKSHIDLDYEIVTKKNMSNPIYYVLYAYARIHQVLEKNFDHTTNYDFDLLKSEEEWQLINLLHSYVHTILSAAKTLEPHKLCNYLYDLAKAFHTFYSKHAILQDDKKLQKQRINLIKMVQQILQNGLTILNIIPQTKM